MPRYVPAERSFGADVANELLTEFLSSELKKISAAINALDEGRFDPQYREPTRPKLAQIAYADGVKWDPGYGAGYYRYTGSAWTALSPIAAGGVADSLAFLRGDGAWTDTLTGIVNGLVRMNVVNQLDAANSVSAYELRVGSNVASFFMRGASSSTPHWGIYSDLVASDFRLYNNNTLCFSVSPTAVLSLEGLFDLSAAGAGQIKFPATQVASSDANTLDDYEESTAATLTGIASTGGTLTSANGTIDYTKIGREILWQATINIVTNGTGVGAIVANFPFTVAGIAPFVGYDTGAGVPLVGYINAGALIVFKYDGTYPAVSGSSLRIGGRARV